jgi:hypothetical protein
MKKEHTNDDTIIPIGVAVVILALTWLGMNVLAHYPAGWH